MMREEVVQALIDAYVDAESSSVPWRGFAAAAFEFSPPPTDEEKAEARRRVETGELDDPSRYDG